MSRRKRRPEPEPVEARPPRWLLFGSIGLVVLLIGPPVAALVAGEGNVAMLGLSLWPLLVVALIWRSRLVADRDGVAFTFLGTRRVPWSDIEALVPTSAAMGLRGPHLRVTDGRPVPLNPLWRADGKTVPVALEPWARRKRVRIDGDMAEATRGRPRMLTIVVLIAAGALLGLLVARISIG